MALFDAMRLRRTTWQDVNQLAQEIFAILDAARVDGLGGPLKINHDGKDAPIQLVMPQGTAAPAVTITIGDRTFEIPKFDTTFDPTSPPPPPPPGGGGSGGGGSEFPDPESSGGTSGDTPPNPPQLPFTTVGRVVSGSGGSYVVDLWLGDPGDGSGRPWSRLPATTLGIDTSETIPPLTWVNVSCFFFTTPAAGLGITCRIVVGPAAWVEEA